MHDHKSTELAQAPEPPQQHQALQSLRTKDSEGPDEAQETAMEPNRRSWNIMECHGTLWNLMESYGKLWNSVEHSRSDLSGSSWNVPEPHGTFYDLLRSIIIN